MFHDDNFNFVEDDGFSVPEVGSWAHRKYKLIRLYSELFTKSMRSKWDCLVYIDLFAGAGLSRIRGTNMIVQSSSLIALGNEIPFDKLIFCEANPDNYDALNYRIKKAYPLKDTTIINGDANDVVPDLKDCVPKGSAENRVLSFCFVDPFNLSNLKFKTIENLSEIYIDFMVLIPSGMDANRNLRYYKEITNPTLDGFLGSDIWRSKWKAKENCNKTFEEYVVEEFSFSMSKLGYINPGIRNCIPIRSNNKHLLMYRLALYSRNPLGKKFWKIAKEYSDPQRTLFDL